MTRDSPGTISRYHIACGLGLFPPPLLLPPFPAPVPRAPTPDEAPLAVPNDPAGLGDGGFGGGARRGNGDGWNCRIRPVGPLLMLATIWDCHDDVLTKGLLNAVDKGLIFIQMSAESSV